MKIIYKEETFDLKNNPLENTDTIIICKLTKSDFDNNNPDNNHYYRIIRYQRPKYPEIFYGIKERTDLPNNNYLRIMPFITNECFITIEEFKEISYLIEVSEEKIKEVPNNIVSGVSHNVLNTIYFKGERFEKKVSGFDIFELTDEELIKRINSNDKVNVILKEHFLNELSFMGIVNKIREFINKKLYN